MQYDDVITNPRWRTDAILKIVFWLYLGAITGLSRQERKRQDGLTLIPRKAGRNPVLDVTLVASLADSDVAQIIQMAW